MDWVFLLLIVAVVVAVIIAMKAKRQSGKSDEVFWDSGDTILNY